MLLFPNGIKGLSDSKWSGVEGSASALVGIDLHSTPGLIKIRQKMTKDSGVLGVAVTELCRVNLAVSTGITIWFSATSGKIWERSTAGTWVLVYTTSPAAGTAGCLGAAEYDGYIYWATQSRLHRILVTGLGGVWTPGTGLNWATFTKTDASWHPMVKQNLQLFIGDASYLAKVDNDTGVHLFTAKALDLNAPFRVKCLIDFDIDILIGTYVSDYVNKTQILRWDTESTSWLSGDTIEENGINAFLRDDNYVYAQCGLYGRWYQYDGSLLVPLLKMPGTWSPSSYGVVNPNAVACHLTIPVFGISNGSGNPCSQGVYSLGSYDQKYPKILDLSYPISTGTLTSIEIGCVLAVGADLFAAWQDGSSYGVDKLDYTAKYASAYIDTMMLTLGEERNFIKTIKKVYASYALLPASTGLTFTVYRYSGDTGIALTSLTDSILKQVRADVGTVPEVANLQLRIAFTVSSNNAPEVEVIGFE